MTSTRLPFFRSLLLMLGFCASVQSTQAQQVVIGPTSGQDYDYYFGPYYRSSSTSSNDYSRYAYLYTAAELNIPAGAIITEIAWLKYDGTLSADNNFDIWLENVTNTTLAATDWGTLTSTATQVYTSTTQAFVEPPDNYEIFPITQFVYDGGNLQILTDHARVTGTASDANYYYVGEAPDMTIGAVDAAPLDNTTILDDGFGGYRPTIRISYMFATDCDASVTAGIAASSVSAVCPSTPFTLSTTGYTAANGLTFQWQESPAGANTFTDISGATSASYTATLTSSTDYQLVVNCTNPGGGTSTSNIVSVTANAAIYCYCASAAAYDGDEEIYSFTLNGVNSNTFANQTNPCTDLAPGPGSIIEQYSNFTTLGSFTTLTQGQSYNFTVEEDECPQNANYYDFGTAIWIDWNQDGVFDDATEKVFVENTPAQGPRNVTGSIVVPSNAVVGQTGLRVLVSEDQAGTDLISCSNDDYGYGETEDYIITIAPGVGCLPPATTINNVTATSADLSWSSVSGAVGYEYIVDQNSGSPAGAGTATTANTTTPNPYTGLNATSVYYLHVRTDCGGGTFSSWTNTAFTTTIPNDDASGAIEVTVNSGCNGNFPYTNVGATQSAGEPFTSCTGTAGYKTVWYKFAAPASGTVRVSTDYDNANLGDSRMAVFAVTDSSDYTTFTILNCDDDNGVITGSKNIEYLNGLTASAMYYVVVDGYSSSTTAGDFCLTVDDVTPAMLAATGSCVEAQSITSAENYTGWTSLVDEDGFIIANVRRDAAISDVSYEGAVTINPVADTLRLDNSLTNIQGFGPYPYLDRNYFLSAGSATVTNAQIAFFMLQEEFDSLGTLADFAYVTRVEGTTCEADLDPNNTNVSLLSQSSSSSNNGVATLNVNTPGFSNYYIHAIPYPLAITMGDISATNIGNRNRVDWNTLGEHAGDRFDIERSADSRTFTKIGSVDAVGTANKYSFFDESPLAGTSYYRLKMTGAGRDYIYSKVVNATVKGTAGTFAVTAYPNPISGNSVTVEVRGTMSADATIAVTDVTGKVVRTMLATGAITELNLNNLSAGVYFIRYNDKEHSHTLKVTKQ